MAHLTDLDLTAPADSLFSGGTVLNTWRTRIDALNDVLGDITTAEADQIEAIGTTTISAAQWAYLGALNQGLTTTSTVTFGTINAFTLGGKLTAGSSEIEGSAFDINGGTVDGITSLTAGGNLDIGAYGFRANTLTADGLTSGRLVRAGTAGLLGDATVTESSGALGGITTLSCGAITSSGTLALGANSITMSGSIGVTGTRVTKGWFTAIEVTNAAGLTIGGTGIGSIYAAVAQTMYIGTTQVAINRSSAALTLAGITLTTPDIGTPSAGTLTNCSFPTLNQNTTGSAATLTTARTIGGVSFNGSANIVPNIVTDTTPQLGGELDCMAHSVGFTQQTATGDGTTTIDWRLGNKFYFTFGAQNDTFTFTAPSHECNLLLVVKQDGTGSRLATWPATVKWPSATAATLSTGANDIDIVCFYYDGTNYNAVASLDFG